MSTEIWILAGFMLAVACLMFWFLLRLTDVSSDLEDYKRRFNEYRKDQYDLRDDYWKLSHRLDALGKTAGYVYKQHDAYWAWEKQS